MAKRLTQLESVIESYATDVINAHSEYEKELNKFHNKMRIFRDRVASLRHGMGLMARKPDSPVRHSRPARARPSARPIGHSEPGPATAYVPSPVRDSPPRAPRVYNIQSDDRRRLDYNTSPKKIGAVLFQVS